MGGSCYHTTAPQCSPPILAPQPFRSGPNPILHPHPVSLQKFAYPLPAQGPPWPGSPTTADVSITSSSTYKLPIWPYGALSNAQSRLKILITYARGPQDCKNNTGRVFFPKELTTAPLITCYSKRNIAFFVISTNILQYLTVETAPRPYVHVFVCGYGSHSANPLMHARSQCMLEVNACSKSMHARSQCILRKTVVGNWNKYASDKI